jgi:aminoglycoside phosphotransferase (APT) family kinase protein
MKIVVECAQSISDPGLPALAEVIDPAGLTSHLRGLGLGRSNGDTVEEARVMRVLKHHAGERCTLEIGWRGHGGWHLLIGKLYREDRPDILTAMQRIEQAGFGPEDQFSIPQPIAYLPELRLLLLENVEGRVAKEIFKVGDERSRAAAAERCGLWLARFHACGPKAGPIVDSAQCLSGLREKKRRIAKAGRRFAEKAEGLFDWLERTGAALRPVELRAGHASFSPAQLILAEGRTVAFDWDGYDVADPARDVARFLAALRRLAIGRLRSIRALDGPADVFLRTYRAAAPLDVTHNLRFFMADACVTLVVYDLTRPGDRWQQKGEALLDESLRIMDGEVAS